MPALSGDLRGARRVEQRVVDVVDLDLDVVRLAPLLRVGPVEPLVVVGDEMGPRHDLELARELSVGELQGTVGRGEGPFGQASEHADCEGGGAASLEQVSAGECRARRCDFFGYVCHE